MKDTIPHLTFLAASIDWNGGQYTEGGLVKRKAIGKGRKFVQDIDAVYSGEVTLPETIGYVWVADYSEDIPDNQSVLYTMAVNAEYAPTISSANEGGFLSKALEAIIGVITAAYTALAASFKEHPVVTSIPFVIFAGLIAFLITRKIKHRCIYDNGIKCPYGKRNKETCKSCPNFYKRSTAPRKEFTFGKKEEREE
ncbi:MAG: hypothetical protein Q3982_07240 [Phoenicibacter congonensis]|uniref:Uncharacterized protein n=1 Tax=Phoenicibacter congonensis TaxID=1944646 RepID=A0AA43RKH3_9ACTN|nr:hypothetical protein [Phoenicibacter congonensis]